MSAIRRAWLGCFAGPILWFAQQQALLWTVGVACGRDWLPVTIAVAFLVPLAVIGLSSSALLVHGPHAAEPARIEGRTRFVEWLGVLSPALFLVAMLWQTMSTLVYPACAR